MDVLDSWIMIEQLSEGSIEKSSTNYRLFQNHGINDYKEEFFSFLQNKKEKDKLSEKRFEKSGLVLYFDIFDFQEVIDILRSKYDISATNEEIRAPGSKFTFALYFDNQLNFISEKTFFTISGYIRYKKELPKNFVNAEATLRDDLNQKFEDMEFNDVITDLLDQYRVSLADCRFGFVENLETGDVNLHSFFIDDLKKAKTVETDNLNRYFSGFLGKRKNLDGNAQSNHFNPEELLEILQPQNYPLGRFPSNTDYALSFMQEVAVNLALNDSNTIRSVNGPPGTGKTTLLKEIFADLVVQQAREICHMSNKKIDGSLLYWENAKLGTLPSRIADKNIVVASSNNGAVQNIVNELPLIEEISEEFRQEILATNYFKTISNSVMREKWMNKNGKRNREIERKIGDEEKWGVFSLEGGKAENIGNLLLNIEFMDTHLKTKYAPNSGIYKEFLTLYKQVLSKRNLAQKYFEKISELFTLVKTHKGKCLGYVFEKQGKLDMLEQVMIDKKAKMESIETELEKLASDLSINEASLGEIFLAQKEAQRNFDVISMQKPNLFWLQKIFNKKVVEEYYSNVNQANGKLNELATLRDKLKIEKQKIEQELKVRKIELRHKKMELELEIREFNDWKKTQADEIIEMKTRIDRLEKYRRDNSIEEVDFSKSYSELQTSNPWFDKEFRIQQSKLFMKSLEVRKQFLYENSKHLRAARIIWASQNKYAAKENGKELLFEAWQWVNFAVPIISTTFASFGKMFRSLNENSIGNLFIDEAGQALPQASVGAIFRSKKVMVVGDPSQIQPVLTLDSNILGLLQQHYRVDEKFISSDSSTQTIVDKTSQYGFKKNEDEWIGIPLWVHRRSNYPMFTISNEVSYDGLMVQGKPASKAYGKADWLDVSGKANDKYVKEQAQVLKTEIMKQLSKDPSLEDDIYVISPFRNVASKLARDLDSINFTKRIKNKAVNVGTVHTFQGKEAKIVYFVLGADSNSKGAAMWAVSEPNIMNVAATRAKEEFYVIGDKKLYSTLGSNVANLAISIIDSYNRD